MSDGIGVMISNLWGGNRGDLLAAAYGKAIKRVVLENDELRFVMQDDTTFALFDDGQSCCESRYMVCDDDLTAFVGATLTSVELGQASSEDGKYGDSHEIQFLDVKTSVGVFSVASHNEHNGCYGGFALRVKP